MIENIGPIKNPLTIIAIFAAIAEISGTLVLPFIATSNQSIYVWFLIVFPVLLIILFFLTLNFNHKVLYAPSDYKNEENFLQSLPRATLAEKVLKIEAEIAEEEKTNLVEVEAPRTSTEIEGAAGDFPVNPSSLTRSSRSSIHASHMLTEELIFRKLSKEFTTEIQREVKVSSPGRRYIFDGIVKERGVTTVIEVRLVQRGFISSLQLFEILTRIQDNAKLLPADQVTNFRLLLALASDESSIIQEQVAAQIDRLRPDFPYPIEVRFYNVGDLEREFDIVA